jgi:ectoine hydroxylase-related dioxygenase (phytanoyl-CoA dioxygenase family)
MRRLKRPDAQHPEFWAFATGVIADVAADLVGPDVVFHHSKLNFKWNDGHDEVAWHQDIQFYPHTNYSPLTIGVYLQDTGMDDGPLGFMPGSHNGPLHDQYGADGRWTGRLSERDVASLHVERAVHVVAPAGSITVHNCRTVHSSPPNRSARPRPLLLNAYASADAFPYTPHPQPSCNTGKLVRGKPARWAHHDPRPCLVPPDWSGGYTSIFAAQAGETGSGRSPDAM